MIKRRVQRFLLAVCGRCKESEGLAIIVQKGDTSRQLRDRWRTAAGGNADLVPGSDGRWVCAPCRRRR